MIEHRRKALLFFVQTLLPCIALAQPVKQSVTQPPVAPASRTVVFWQPGFPTVDSQPIDRDALAGALDGLQPQFVDLAGLMQSGALRGTRLLVLPYGSAVPVEAWATVLDYLKNRGNLLVLGGQPLRVPVRRTATGFTQERPQDSYAMALGLRHSYEIPVSADAVFAWREGYGQEATPGLKAGHFYAEEGRLDGLGYMVGPDGQKLSAPVIVADRHEGAMAGGRMVALDFNPAAGYWSTADARTLLRRSAGYAAQGAETFSVETLFSSLRPAERPTLSVHLRPGCEDAGTTEVKAVLRSKAGEVESVTLPLASNASGSFLLEFHKDLAPGFYDVEATWMRKGEVLEFYRNGFWVTPADALKDGPRLGTAANVLTRDGKPFLPVGTNYFTTEENGWDFSGPRNAAVWESDFAAMQAHGVSFVRTGVWMSNAGFLEGDLGGVNERFLRNLEAFLLSAQRHSIAVNFTFFAFVPKPDGLSPSSRRPEAARNPYLNADLLRAQQNYVRSIVARFGRVPFLSWDLINEPSVSNPANIFKGNYPNDDSDEQAAWHEWLRSHYSDLFALAGAWSTTPEELSSFDSIPLPSIADLTYDRYGDPREVRALDYNLFAQDVFRGWVRRMVQTVRDTGSTQLIDVGQDEGGVTNRVLNQFDADAGLSFTTNHTYWEDDGLLFDSLAAKVVGIPNITGETGYQPAWAPDGAWRYDELTGLGLTERKWALGFAAGTTGAMQWDWAREVDFGMLRSDGSSKVWEDMMRDLGRFAQQAAPYTATLDLPDTAIVLPQSLQLSVLNSYAVQAQKTAVRALYQARGTAYAVGEYQIERLGRPKLILLPSPMGLTAGAWQEIERSVREGATLLVTGPFDGDAHLHPTDRAEKAGLSYDVVPLDLREETLQWPGGNDVFTFSGKTTTVLNRARLSGGESWKELSLGRGRILFAALPLELSDNLTALARVYRYALGKSGAKETYTTDETNPGILICPTVYAGATLYVVTSETAVRKVSFRDIRSGHELFVNLAAGRAAMVMITPAGRIVASYNWN